MLRDTQVKILFGQKSTTHTCALLETLQALTHHCLTFDLPLLLDSRSL